jgi:hypothetical protein
MKKHNLTKQEKKQAQQQRRARRSARGRQWTDQTYKVIY